ncbi:MAG TPA: YhfC family glutamic-type intramembrane protease, partial [Sphaerochaeta sp.]|nr:YhfC family glutamic-type intramembrane protease [Sphaerochaeta sp.]
VHQVVLTQTAIAHSLVPFAIYAAAMAAIFEEGGRYLAFRTILKNRTPRKEEALMAGAGHGGMEVLLIFTVGMVVNLYYALVLYRGGGASLLGTMGGEVPSLAETIFSALTYTAPLAFLVGLFERMVAMVLHLSFALFVWLSVQQKRKMYLGISLGIHFVVDFVAVLLSRSGVSILLIELVVALMAAGAFYWALQESRRWEAVENKEATADLLPID